MIERKLIFGLALVIVLALAIFLFIALRPSELTPTSTSTSTSTTIKFASSNSSLNISVPTTTTILFSNFTPGIQEFENDIQAAQSVKNKTLIYSANIPSLNITEQNAGSIQFFQNVKNTKFVVNTQFNGNNAPVYIYNKNNVSILCAQQFVQNNSIQSKPACFTGQFSATNPLTGLKSLLNPNVSDYANLTYVGNQTVDNQLCNAFSSPLSANESSNLMQENLIPPSTQPTYGVVCLSPKYGYPLFNIILQPNGTSTNVSKILEILLVNSSTAAPSAKQMSFITPFAVNMQYGCANNTLSFNLTPLDRQLVNPNVSVGMSILVANSTLQNITMNSVETGTFNALTSYPIKMQPSNTLNISLNNSLQVIYSYVCINGVGCEPIPPSC